MAIVKLKKLTLCGRSVNKTETLRRLQLMGGLHLIPLRGDGKSAKSDVTRHSEAATQALKFLHDCSRKRQQIKTDPNFNMENLVGRVIQIKNRSRELGDRYDALGKRIEEVEPWGDFRLPNEGCLGGQLLWFYIVPERMMSEVKQSGLVWETVFRDNLYAYVVVISPTEPPENAMPVARTHVGAVPLSELRLEQERIQSTLEDLHAERESLTRWTTLMTLHFNEALDEEELNQAHGLTRDEVGVFAIQGWLAEDDLPRYRKFAEDRGLALLIEDPGEADNPPTLLSNPPEVAGGQDLVGFYQTPNYRGWDPSSAVFFSFASFFAMILSDAGYAAVFAALLGLKWRRLGRSERGRRLRILALDTLVLSIIWGVLLGSYFGHTPSSTSWLARFKLLDLNDFDTMMGISISVGVSHIVLANAIKAYCSPSWHGRISPLGWIAMISGGVCYWLSLVAPYPYLSMAGQSLIGLGIALLVLFASDRPLHSGRDALLRLFDGLKNLIGVTQLFGDVLSYMRLFALGLASASLALTFNQLALQVLHALPGLGLLFCMLILVAGHTLNLLLCLMSGVVHGLRLNFIEFYNWGVSDEGYPFKTFSKRGLQP